MQIVRYNSIKWAFNIHATCEVCCFRSFSRIIFMQTARDCNLLWNGLSAGKHWLWWWCGGGGGGIFQKQKRKILKWKANPIISIKRTVLSSRHEWSQLAVVRALSKVLIVDDDGQKNRATKKQWIEICCQNFAATNHKSYRIEFGLCELEYRTCTYSNKKKTEEKWISREKYTSLISIVSQLYIEHEHIHMLRTKQRIAKREYRIFFFPIVSDVLYQTKTTTTTTAQRKRSTHTKHGPVFILFVAFTLPVDRIQHGHCPQYVPTHM